MSSSYVTNVESRVLAAVQSELSRKEELQHRHGYVLHDLHSMVKELPRKYQQTLSQNCDLSLLATSLLDGTVYNIVAQLQEVQHMEEQNLFNSRKRLIAELNDKKKQLQEKHKERIRECQSALHNLPLVTKQNEEELAALEKQKLAEVRRQDMKIISALDQKVMDQQGTLEKAGVVGFSVTNNPEEVKLQMYLLDFITRLSSTYSKSQE